MKHKNLLPLFILCLAGFAASAQDNYLTAKSYFLRKGNKMEINLVSGEQFKDLDYLKYDGSKTTSFNLYDNGKKTNLMTAAKDSADPVFVYVTPNIGLITVEMTRKIPPTPIDHDVYAKYLGDEGLTKLAETVNNSNQSSFREKKVCYLKTMLEVDKSTGDFEKPLGQEFEITLKKNPYKLNYGEDMIGVLTFKGKPVKDGEISILLKVPSGNVYADRTTTNAKGEFSFTTTREGVYMLRAARTVASTTNDADFETIQTAFTFLFNSTNSHSNDIKNFGLEDRGKN